MKRSKKDKGLVQVLDDLLAHAQRMHKKAIALAKEDTNLKKLKADLKRVLKSGK